MTPHLSPTYTGADHAAVDAYVAAVDALVRLRVSAEELESRLEHCREFAVGQAYAAFVASLGGSSTQAARHARLARRSRHGITRRERQLVEILLSPVDGDHHRAAALVREHVSEFADDARTLSIIDRWSHDQRVT
jgi:hypothetical protein